MRRGVLALFILLFILVCAPRSQAQNNYYRDISLSWNGVNLVPNAGAEVSVCALGAVGTPCSPTITLYANSTGSITETNPITTGSDGSWSLYLPTGQYSYTVTGTGLNPQGPFTFTVPLSSGGTLNPSNLNNIIFVDGVTYSLTDVGAGINAAYAACPVSNAVGGSACLIVVPPNPTGACRTLTTPVNLNTSGKLVMIDLSGSCINDPSITTHNSFTFDYMPSTGTLSFNPQHGMRNGTLINNGCTTNGGCSSSATAIANGTVNYGAQLGEFSNLKIEGYLYPFAVANGNAWGEMLFHNTFTHNSGGVFVTTSVEQMKLDDNAWLSNAIDLDVSANAEIEISNSHLDQATVCSINTHTAVPRITLVADRFENLNLSNGPCYSEGANGYYVLKGVHAMDDHGVGASVTAWFTGGYFVGDIGLFTGGRLTNPNYLFTVNNQANLSVFIETPGTLDAQHIAFPGTGSCLQVMTAGVTAVWNTCGGVLATVSRTAQAANISATTLYAVPSNGAGMYRISCYVVVTQAATSSSTLPACDVLWTDADSSASETGQLTNTNAGNVLGGNGLGGGWPSSLPINAKASTNIQYSLGSYASSGATPMQYAVHLRLEFLGP